MHFCTEYFQFKNKRFVCDFLLNKQIISDGIWVGVRLSWCQPFHRCHIEASSSIPLWLPSHRTLAARNQLKHEIAIKSLYFLFQIFTQIPYQFVDANQVRMSLEVPERVFIKRTI